MQSPSNLSNAGQFLDKVGAVRRELESAKQARLDISCMVYAVIRYVGCCVTGAVATRDCGLKSRGDSKLVAGIQPAADAQPPRWSQQTANAERR